jgi:thiamine-monophosphate kinase
MGFSEAQVIELLAQIFGSEDPRVIIGIGDDAALVQGFSQQILTTDVAVEGTHFRSDWSSAYEIGKRIAAANIADVLSMNGRCDYLLVAASLTGSESLDWIRDLAQGIADEAKSVGAVVVGGDLAKSPTLSIAITAIGRTDRVITRTGATVGDSIFLSSLTGWSATGLEILQKNLQLSDAHVARAIHEYRAPTLDFQIDFSAATSMCDVSDALVIQGAQMANASGVQFAIDGDLIAQSPEFALLAELAGQVGADIWSWILQGGEDHVLMATGHDLPGIRIGTVLEGAGISATYMGAKIEMAPVAWSHFR